MFHRDVDFSIEHKLKYLLQNIYILIWAPEDTNKYCLEM